MPRLNEPFFLQVWLLERPTPLIVVLLLMVAGLWWYNRYRQQRGLRLAMWACLVLVPGVWLLADTVTTQRERIAVVIGDLVVAAERADLKRMGEILDPQIALRAGGKQCYEGDMLLARFEQAVARYPIATQRGTIRAIEVTGDRARATLSVNTILARGSYHQGSLVTTWLLHLRQDEHGQWRIVELDWLRLGLADANCGMVNQ